MRREQPCWLYVIADDHQHCKLGIANYPLYRVNELQVGNPYQIRLHSAWKFPTKDTAFCMEQVALYASRRHALRGEWRHGHPEQIARLVNWLVSACARISLTPGHDMRWVRVRGIHSSIAMGGDVRVLDRMGS